MKFIISIAIFHTCYCRRSICHTWGRSSCMIIFFNLRITRRLGLPGNLFTCNNGTLMAIANILHINICLPAICGRTLAIINTPCRFSYICPCASNLRVLIITMKATASPGDWNESFFYATMTPSITHVIRGIARPAATIIRPARFSNAIGMATRMINTLSRGAGRIAGIGWT